MAIIKLRRDTAANFTSANRIYAEGELMYETDTLKEKVGDGITPWINLPYKASGFTPSTLLADYNFTDNSSNWDTAFGWGNHASQGYLTSVPAQTWSSITGKPTTIGGYGITDFNSLGDARWALTSHNHSGVYEPVFTKNTGFNKNYGTTSGTVAQGNDSRINNGQTAFSWGNHASAGYSTQTLIAGTGIDITGSTISATAVPIGPTPSQTGTVLDISNNTTGILYNLITPSAANSFSVTNLVRGGFITNYIDTTGKADFPTVTNSSGSVIPSKSDAFREGATFKMIIETDGTNIEVFYVDYLNLAQTGGITYTAGANVNIDGNNVISATDTNTTYTAGTGISIDGSNVISATGGGGSGVFKYSESGDPTAIVRSDRVAADYGLMGLRAIDFSYTDTEDWQYGARGIQSVAFGLRNQVGGHTATSFGSDNKSTSGNTFTAGEYGIASAQAAISLSSYGEANGAYSLTVNRANTVNGRAGAGFGEANTSNSFGEFVAGLFGTIQSGSGTTHVPTDRVFNIGIGTGGGARADGLTVLKDGTILGPSLTEALIDSGTGRILITKEYLKASNIDWSGLPTSASGLQTGDIWNNGGVLTIV